MAAFQKERVRGERREEEECGSATWTGRRGSSAGSARLHDMRVTGRSPQACPCRVVSAVVRSHFPSTAPRTICIHLSRCGNIFRKQDLHPTLPTITSTRSSLSSAEKAKQPNDMCPSKTARGPLSSRPNAPHLLLRTLLQTAASTHHRQAHPGPRSLSPPEPRSFWELVNQMQLALQAHTTPSEHLPFLTV